MVRWLYCVSVCLGIAGMMMGIGMGVAHNFRLAPLHAHLLLVGFVVMFIQALYYTVVPSAAKSKLAKFQMMVAILGSIVFPAGIACILLIDRATFLPLLAAGWVTVLSGMILFSVIVIRTSDFANKEGR